MNYTELSTAIKDYTQNFESDFIANIPVFVEQAEQAGQRSQDGNRPSAHKPGRRANQGAAFSSCAARR